MRSLPNEEDDFNCAFKWQAQVPPIKTSGTQRVRFLGFLLNYVQASVARTFGMSGKVADHASSAAKPGGSSRRHPRWSPAEYGRDWESVARKSGRGG